MPINPNIAMGYQGVQLNNPLDAYAKMSQIQGAQNQNALAQYQLAAAQRADAGQNALSSAVKDSIDPTTGEVNVNALTRKLGEAGQGGMIPEVLKKYQDAANAKTTGQKAKIELLGSALDQYKKEIDSIDPASPDAAKRAYALHMANHAPGSVISEALRPPIEAAAKQAGMTYEEYLPKYMDDRRAEIEAAAAKGPSGLSAWIKQASMGTTKFAEYMKGTNYQQSNGAEGWITNVKPDGTSSVVPGTQYTQKMTPGQAAQLQLAQQRENRLSAGGPGGSAATANASGDVDPTIDAAAQRYRANGTLPSLSGKEGTAFKKQVLARAAQLDIESNVSAADAVVGQAEGKAVEMSMKQMQKTRDNIDAYERQFQKNMTIAKSAFDKLDNTKMPLLNKWINAGKRNLTGDPDIAAVDTAVKAVVDEFSKIVSGAMGNTVVAQGQIKRVEKLLNDAQSPEQVKAALDVMEQETHNRIKGFDETQAAQRDKLKPKSPSKSEGNKPSVSNW